MKTLLATASAIVIAVAALVSVGPPTTAAAAIDARNATTTIWHSKVAGTAPDRAFQAIPLPCGPDSRT